MEVVTADCPLGAKCEDIKEIKDKKVIVRCPWYQSLRGKDPQSDQEIDEWRCSIAWLPLLAVEHSLFERQTGAAVESLRNKITEDNKHIGALLLENFDTLAKQVNQLSIVARFQQEQLSEQNEQVNNLKKLPSLNTIIKEK